MADQRLFTLFFDVDLGRGFPAETVRPIPFLFGDRAAFDPHVAGASGLLGVGARRGIGAQGWRRWRLLWLGLGAAGQR